MRSSVLFPAFVLIAAPLLADTIVVDDDGGADYTDIPPAVAAANPGDLVLVLPGDYSGFTLDKGLTILGAGDPLTVIVDDTVIVDGAQVTRPIVLSTFYCRRLQAQQCAGLLLLEEMELGYAPPLDTGGATALLLNDCADVRALRTKILGGPDHASVDVASSRVEIVQSYLWAGGGCSYEPPFKDPPDCYAGVCLAAKDSTVRFALSSAVGEEGQNGIWDLGGDGADGFEVEATDLLISGRPTDVIQSGDGGVEWGDCGVPVLLSGSDARISGVRVSPGCPYFWYDTCCDAVVGCCLDVPASPDPTLEPVGVAVPGSPIELRLRAPSGSSARILIGREPTVRARPNVIEDLLTVPILSADLGLVPPSGDIAWNLPIPGNMKTGDVLFAQAVVILPGGEVRLSHSVPLLVH